MYCELKDLTGQINENYLLSFVKESTDQGDEYIPRIDECIGKASSLIDGYIGKRYPVPLKRIPEVIKDKCVEIAIYKIICRKGLNKNAEESIWLDRYNSAISFLKDLRDGKNDIGIPDDEGNAVVVSPVKYKTKERVFQDSFWKGF